MPHESGSDTWWISINYHQLTQVVCCNFFASQSPTTLGELHLPAYASSFVLRNYKTYKIDATL
ncbi:MAG: hypothetical protein JW922_01960 [Paludibacteraceae bacterium]|nr:hypothetical protein [Paludibacteraceae bacterium]